MLLLRTASGGFIRPFSLGRENRLAGRDPVPRDVGKALDMQFENAEVERRLHQRHRLVMKLCL